jgi:quinol monooxygenase YgiN
VILAAKDLADVPQLRDLLTTQVALSREESGCVRFDAFESQTVPGTFIVVERWASEAALEAHRGAEAITTVYLPRIMPLVDRVLHVCSALPGT